jgi:hypothetical protein
MSLTEIRNNASRFAPIAVFKRLAHVNSRTMNKQLTAKGNMWGKINSKVRGLAQAEPSDKKDGAKNKAPTKKVAVNTNTTGSPADKENQKANDSKNKNSSKSLSRTKKILKAVMRPSRKAKRNGSGKTTITKNTNTSMDSLDDSSAGSSEDDDDDDLPSFSSPYSSKSNDDDNDKAFCTSFSSLMAVQQHFQSHEDDDEEDEEEVDDSLIHPTGTRLGIRILESDDVSFQDEDESEYEGSEEVKEDYAVAAEKHILDLVEYNDELLNTIPEANESMCSLESRV